MDKKDNNRNPITTSSMNIEKDSLSAEVPEQFQSVFLKAQSYIDRYFNNRNSNAKEGMIEISGERYLLLRADTLALDFFDSVHPEISHLDAENAEKSKGRRGFLRLHNRLLCVLCLSQRTLRPIFMFLAGYSRSLSGGRTPVASFATIKCPDASSVMTPMDHS